MHARTTPAQTPNQIPSFNMENSITTTFEDVLTFALEKLGKKNFRLKQQQYEAIRNITVDNQDTVCVLPTGYGKSLIYQLLADVFDYYLSKTTSRKSGKTELLLFHNYSHFTVKRTNARSSQ